LPLRLTLGEHHRRLLLFGGQDLELFLLFSDAHRQPLGTLAEARWRRSGWRGHAALPRPASTHNPWPKVKGVLEPIIPAGFQRCLGGLLSGLL
jgi:hypothetical protein